MRVGAETHVGRIRRSNEDAFYVGPSLLVVADGMGGHAAGEVASRLAVETLAEYTSWISPLHDLRIRLLRANERILQSAQADPVRAGMGTTVTAAYCRSGILYYAHIGDSRLYLFREGTLVCITQDHSLVGELQRIGGLTESEARVHPQRNVLTRALGVAGGVEIDTGVLQLQLGDRCLLSTDGLHNDLTDAQISRVLAGVADPAQAASQLVRTANSMGGTDNITVIVADVTREDLS